MITSTSNQKVKRLASLRKKRKERDAEQIFLTEGIRMFREVPSDRLAELYVTADFYEKNRRLVEETAGKAGICPEVFSDQVFAYISDTKTPQGVLCVVRRRQEQKPEELLGGGRDGRPPLLMILDRLQDPGNLGTILRTGEGAGVTGILLSRDCVDLYNPKTIRSTMGSIYRMPCAYVDHMEELFAELRERKICTYAAHLEGQADYDEEDYTKGSAFLIGNEGNGLSREVADLADVYIRIPMEGEVESYNAAIAATVLMFEAGRQRRVQHKTKAV